MSENKNINLINEEIDDVCEECKEFSKSVKSNLITSGYKVCDSCKISKTLFPL